MEIKPAAAMVVVVLKKHQTEFRKQFLLLEGTQKYDKRRKLDKSRKELTLCMHSRTKKKEQKSWYMPKRTSKIGSCF